MTCYLREGGGGMGTINDLLFCIHLFWSFYIANLPVFICKL